MQRSKRFAWSVVVLTLLLLLATAIGGVDRPSAGELAFWFGLAAAAELLAISLGRSAEVSMAFPIHLTLAIVFRGEPLIPMVIAAAAAFDLDEFRLSVDLHKTAFNRATAALAVGGAVLPLHLAGDEALSIVPILLASTLHLLVNLGLVAAVVRVETGAGASEVLDTLVPRPVAGFLVSYSLLTGLGAATAIAYERIPHGGWAVAAILIPLLFARVSIIAARGQQELSERLQKQQRALLEMTQNLFHDREKERQRIAADIHDSSLQSLAAAAFACGNALEALDEGDVGEASNTIAGARSAVIGAIEELRESLTDLRSSALEEGGLTHAIDAFVLQVRTLWGREIAISNRVEREPPIPVALAAFQILQEGVTNALKHSQDAPIRVQISDDEEGALRVVVQDEGPGFETGSAEEEGHLGLRLMNERATQIGGRIELDSIPGRGTRLEAILPGGGRS